MNLLMVLLVLAAVTGLTMAGKTAEATKGDKKPERVLLLGDSFANGLTAPMRSAATAAGWDFRVLAKDGTRIDHWAQSEGLTKLLTEYQPTLVFVVLGTNDEYMGPGVVDSRREAMHALLSKITVAPGFREVVWVGPPTIPRPSNGVTDMLKDALEPAYFDSRALEIPRAGDGLHPTGAGYKKWAEAIWAGR